MQKAKNKLGVNNPCPCGSGKKYKKCCQLFHKGKLPKTSLELMRSRYVAYIIFDSNYIIKTTHINNPDFTTDYKSWSNDIIDFCQYTNFEKLDIINFIDGDNISYVEFKVKLTINNKDESFQEKSKFIKVNNMWQYHSGEFND